MYIKSNLSVYLLYLYYLLNQNIDNVWCAQVSGYLKKQVAEQEGGEMSEEVKRMMEEHDKLVEEIFQHEDKDKNGFISHDEFSGPKHDEL